LRHRGSGGVITFVCADWAGEFSREADSFALFFLKGTDGGERMKKSVWLSMVALGVLAMTVAGCGSLIYSESGGGSNEYAAAPGPKTYEKMSLKTIQALQPKGKWVEVEASYGGQRAAIEQQYCPDSIFSGLHEPGKTAADGGAQSVFLEIGKDKYSSIESLSDGDRIIVKGYVTSEYCKGAGMEVPMFRYIWADSVEKAAPDPVAVPLKDDSAAAGSEQSEPSHE